jgi:hypothetical protein
MLTDFSIFINDGSDKDATIANPAIATAIIVAEIAIKVGQTISLS